MHPHEKLYDKRKRLGRAFGGSVEGRAAGGRLDRKTPPKKRAVGGSSDDDEALMLQQRAARARALGIPMSISDIEQPSVGPPQLGPSLLNNPEKTVRVRARGGSIKENFNAAVNDQPARPTIREPNAVNAVHLLKRGGNVSRDEWGDKHEDKAADAAMIKSAIRQHETAEHGGEHKPIHLAKGGGPGHENMGWVDGVPGKERRGGGRLTASERQHLPKGDFALPGKGAGPKGAGAGSYPIPDASHARNALARVSQHGSPAEKAAVRAKVHAKYPGIGGGS